MASQPSPAQDYGASRNDSFFSAKSYSVSFAGSPGEREPLVLPKHQFPSGSAGYAGTAAGLVNTLGVKFCIMLIIGQCWVKGFISSMDSTMQPYIFASYHVPAPQVLIYQGVISIPWCMKPLFGILSDAVPLCGLSRAPYILNATLCGFSFFFQPLDQFSIAGRNWSMGLDTRRSYRRSAQTRRRPLWALCRRR